MSAPQALLAPAAAAAPDETPAAAKWVSFYDRNFTPWDTRRPSSQLHAYLTTCPAEWPSTDISSPAPGTQPREPVLPPPAPPPLLSPLETHKQTNSSNAGSSSKPTAEPTAALGPAPQYHRCSRCEALKPHRGAAALEIGCGTGASCVHLARAGLRAVGIDLVPAAVAAAREAAAAAGVSDRCAFAVADVLRLPPGFGWDEAKRLEQQQEASDLLRPMGTAADGSSSSSTAGAAEAAAGGMAAEAHRSSGRSGGGGGGFQLITDCQTFHVLWEQQDRAGAAFALARLLAPGGRLMLLTGNAEEPECGPAVLSEAQLRAAFPETDGWRWGWLLRSRFDETPHYRDVLKKRPLAWWGLLLRAGEAGCST